MARKIVNHPELQRHSPRRPLAWRWQRARHLVENGRYVSRHRDDDQTGRAVRYLRALQRCQGERGQERLARSYPDVHAARLLHEEGGRTCLLVQARLLARQSPGAVAARTGVPADVVRAYEALFFNVLDRLGSRDWITSQAVRWWDFIPAQGRPAATVLKGFAYFGGPLLLDALLPYLVCEQHQNQDDADPAHESPLERRIRLAIDLEMLPRCAEADQKLLKLHVEVLAASRQTASGRTNRSVVAQYVTEMLLDGIAEVVREAARQARTAG
jgi:hypothetical protein